MVSRTYPSKLLLFGEYTAVWGADALALPFHHFHGAWQWDTSEDAADLLAWSTYLSSQGAALTGLAIDRFVADIKQGLRFRSSIPIGYGLGSSGALSAALFDRYAGHDRSNIVDIRAVLIALESFFHGTSSGIDPLVSYLDRSILAGAQGKIEIMDAHLLQSLETPTFFLVDSHLSRRTAPLVARFRDKCRDPAFVSACQNELMPINQQAIQAVVHGKSNALASAFADISRFQMQHFNEMITDDIQSLWQDGLVSGQYYLKLCGAGGGGFYLGMTTDPIDLLPQRVRSRSVLITNLA